MGFYSETLGLPDSAFILLRELIKEKTGIFYEDGKRDILGDKLSPLVLERGFNSFLDYYYYLKYDRENEREWERVFDALTVPETYFWRETDQIRALVDIIVPEHYKKKKEEVLRIWSAACATGEEPLTIAIELNEAGWFEKMPIEINATDASRRSIERAKEGLYRERSFRSTPSNLKEKYFTKRGNMFKVSEDIQRRVKFGVANLLETHKIYDLAASHVIFCRNVFIYFNESVIQRVVKFFYEKMLCPGYLFVGAAESLLRVTSDFTLKEIGGAFCYVK
ncbi:MAG: protein-glutamate O-methyltransferase CheR [Syntrophorhabdaceae bacterium]|nr:protein-glutamate O-methyltransferase CheR [Syntrophorhabdaceae bacterium]